MKKLTVFALLLVLCICLCACGESEKQATLGDDFSSADTSKPSSLEEADINLPSGIDASIGPTTSEFDKHWGNSLINYSTGLTCLAETEDKVFHNFNEFNRINIIDKSTWKSSYLGHRGKNLNVYNGSLYFIDINSSNNYLYKYDIETYSLTSISPSKIWGEFYRYSFIYDFTISNLLVGDYGILFNMKLFWTDNEVSYTKTYLVHSDYDGNTINWKLLSDTTPIYASPAFKYVPINDSKVCITENTSIDYKSAFIYDASSQSLTSYESSFPIRNFSTLGDGVCYYTDGCTNELYTYNVKTKEQVKSDIIQRYNKLPSSVKFILCGNSILFYSFPDFDVGEPSYLLHMLSSGDHYSIPRLDSLSSINFSSAGKIFAALSSPMNLDNKYIVLSPNFEALKVFNN